MTPLANFNFDTYPLNNAGLPNTQSFNCHVKRHLMTTSPRQHGRPAELNADSAIHTHMLTFRCCES
jgi:hypothetical protein